MYLAAVRLLFLLRKCLRLQALMFEMARQGGRARLRQPATELGCANGSVTLIVTPSPLGRFSAFTLPP